MCRTKNIQEAVESLCRQLLLKCCSKRFIYEQDGIFVGKSASLSEVLFELVSYDDTELHV